MELQHPHSQEQKISDVWVLRAHETPSQHPVSKDMETQGVPQQAAGDKSWCRTHSPIPLSLCFSL